jgi:nickel transport protein
MKQILRLSPLLYLPILTWSVKVLAHGAHITYKETPGIEITALYDQGDPMSNAQVVIYAPADPATAWLKGETDAEGRFTFVPDFNQSGNWDVKVRKAGHGALISIPLEANSPTETTTIDNSPQSDYTVMQKMLMSISGVWGFIGTALFFSRKPKT